MAIFEYWPRVNSPNNYFSKIHLHSIGTNFNTHITATRALEFEHEMLSLEPEELMAPSIEERI